MKKIHGKNANAKREDEVHSFPHKRHGCRAAPSQNSCAFCEAKCGSERAVSKVGYFFDSLSSLKLSLYIAMT